MKNKLKKGLVWGILGAVFYFFLSYHIVFIGSNIKLLKKSHFTLEYTIFSTQGKTNDSILRVDDLRRDGIGQLLVDEGKMSQEELDMILDRYKE